MGESENERNRRKRERLDLSLPIRVLCRETLDKSWEDVAQLIDVTPFGAGLALARALRVGQLLQLMIPMPRRLRCYDHAEPQYRVWSLVRHVRKTANEQTNLISYQIGVAFIGKYPPASYINNPATLYEALEPDATGFWLLHELQSKNATTESSSNALGQLDWRHFTRHQIPLNVTIEVINERGETVASEMTVTENIGLIGASVSTTLNVESGQFVRLSSEQYGVTIVAIVRTRKTSNDGVTHLHLEFIDRQFPLEAVQ